MTDVHRKSTAVSTTTRAVAHERYGSPDVLELREVGTPSPGEGEVLLRVTAAALNPYDWHFTTGSPYVMRLVGGLRRPKQPIRGADVAGRIVALGDGVTSLAVGDRVAGFARGSFAEHAVANAASLARIPDGLDDSEAAALPMAATTALQALRDQGEVQPGQRVLVNGAAGGVGTCTVQLAVAMGAEVTGVCSARNVELVRSLGAVRVVDYTNEDWVDGSRYDVIVDNVGNRSAAECRRSLTPSGRCVMVGGPKQNPWLDPFGHLIAGKVGFAFRSQEFHWFTATGTATDLAAIWEYVDRGQLRPVIDRRIGLDGVADAMRDLATGHTRGKIVVVP